MYKTAVLLAQDGYCCNTGAALSSDQAFANGADSVGECLLELKLPWPNYEHEWRTSLKHVQGVTIINPLFDKAAFDSVTQFHPAPAGLKQSVVKLHARNYLIINGVRFVVCWTPNGNIVGGTGQALRIALHMNIPIYNLGIPETLLAFQQKIAERGL